MKSENWQRMRRVRYGTRFACSDIKIPTAKKVARMQHSAFFKRGPLLEIKLAF
jgi:hypothetical protein